MRGFIFRSWLDGLFQVYQRNIPLRQRQLLLLLLLLNFVEQRLLLLLLLSCFLHSLSGLIGCRPC